MQKLSVFCGALSLVGCAALFGCSGEAGQQSEQRDRTALLELSAWAPSFELGSNNNNWWLEVFVHDDRTRQVVVTTTAGTSIPLSPTTWGSFATGRQIRAGTRIRLTFVRDDGASVSTGEFRYLRESASPLETPDVTTPEPNEPPPPPTSTPGAATDTYTVSNGKLLDTCGQEVLLRGVNKMHVWTDPSGTSLPEIAKTGANTVRIVWDTSGSPAALNALIQRARDNALLPMIELHDATGDLSGVPALVDWWTGGEVVQLIARHQRALLVNIANEAGDWNITDSAWVNTYQDAITRMRRAGIRTPLVIDTRGWGHDTDLILSHGPNLLAADPLKNVIFSTHQYYASASVGSSYHETTFAALARSGLTVVIGEFGDVASDCSQPVDYRALITAANKHGLGWYAWSWGPGNTPCTSLDMTRDGTYATLRGWGLEVATTHQASIANTAKPARVSDSTDCR